MATKIVNYFAVYLHTIMKLTHEIAQGLFYLTGVDVNFSDSNFSRLAIFGLLPIVSAKVMGLEKKAKHEGQE